MKHIVEVVVCVYNDEGERWHAEGRIVGEFDGPAAAQVVADKMVKAGEAVRDVLCSGCERRAGTGGGVRCR